MSAMSAMRFRPAERPARATTKRADRFLSRLYFLRSFCFLKILHYGT